MDNNDGGCFYFLGISLKHFFPPFPDKTHVDRTALAIEKMLGKLTTTIPLFGGSGNFLHRAGSHLGILDHVPLVHLVVDSRGVIRIYKSVKWLNGLKSN